MLKNVLVAGSLGLLVAVTFAACGSDDGKKTARGSDAGAGGEEAIDGAGGSMLGPGGAPSTAGETSRAGQAQTGGQGGEPPIAGNGGEGGQAPSTVELTVVADDGGEVEVSGAGCAAEACTLDPRAEVTLSATADDGYRFAVWQGGPGCDGETDNPLDLAVNESMTCTATFIRRFSVAGTTNGAPSGAEVQASAPNAVLADCVGAGCEVDSGAEVVLTAPLVAGYYVASWSGEGCPASGSQITVPADADRTCTANYAPGLAVSGTVTGRTGQVSASSASAGAACSENQCVIAPGATVTLTRPSDAANARWLGWFGAAGCTGSADSVQLANVTVATSCEARFIPRILATALVNGPDAAAVVATSDPNGTCGDGACYADPGSDLTFSAPTNVAGWQFESWSGDCDDSNAETQLFAVDDDVTCTANYQELYLVTGNVVGGATTVSASADGNCSANHCTVLPSQQVVFHASGNYDIISVTGAGCSLGSDEGVVIATADASFDGQTCAIVVAPATDLQLTAAGAGTVSLSDDGGLDCFGQATGFVRCLGPVTAPVTIVATPEPGVTFVGWSGANCPVDGVTTPTATFTPAGGVRQCTATFAGDPDITITTEVAEGGFIIFTQPVACQFESTCTAPAGTTFRISVQTEPGYLIDGFTDSRCQDMYDTGLALSESIDCYLNTHYQGGM